MRNWYRTVTRQGVKFLDAVIDINNFPVPEIREKTLLTRKIGLGIMGLADAFILMEIPYESKEALAFADRTMALISREAQETSRELGEEKGSFPAIDKSIYTGPMRNATVTTIAPTGSLHLIADTSSGIEPLFSLAGTRRMGEWSLPLIHPPPEKISPVPQHRYGYPCAGEADRYSCFLAGSRRP